MTTIVLPKASHRRCPSPSHRGQGSVDVPTEVHHHQELHVHDDRTQTVAMGVDPVEYGRMVGEAQRLLLDESKSRADWLRVCQERFTFKPANKFNNL